MDWKANMKSVMIKGTKYKIKLIKDLTKYQGCYGQCSRVDKKEIELEYSMNSELYTKTLIHELMHGLFYETGVTQAIPLELEEVLCENISNQMWDTFFHPKNNPKISKKKKKK